MTFIKNIWYVAAWTTEMEVGKPIGRTIIGEPVVIWKDSKDNLIAMEDRCPHRHAPLSLGRIDSDQIQCMYHGLKFSSGGDCIEVPGSDKIPPNCSIKTYPVTEKNDWIWVWFGDPDKADPALIPDAFALDSDRYYMMESALDYEAHYQLIHDNLTDLSHLDFVHESTLGEATGQIWSEDAYNITTLDDGLLFERWLWRPVDEDNADKTPNSWNRYRFLLPGLFLMEVNIYPPGTAEKCNFKDSPETLGLEPVYRRVEQQAVTPISETQTRYMYATGLDLKYGERDNLEERMGVVNAAFAEDRVMIESQQKIWNLSDQTKKKAFIPYDKAPNMFRKFIERRIKKEAS